MLMDFLIIARKMLLHILQRTPHPVVLVSVSADASTRLWMVRNISIMSSSSMRSLVIIASKMVVHLPQKTPHPKLLPLSPRDFAMELERLCNNSSSS